MVEKRFRSSICLQRTLLDEESKQYVTINTHLGLYRYTRLPFGVAASPAIFQKTMDVVMSGLQGVGGILDDLIVTGKTDEEHLQNLESTLNRLQSMGIKLKKSKCVLMKSSVEYFAFIVDRQGIHPSPRKVQAIREVPVPENSTELKSFLGLVNYYRKFIPDMSTLVNPLNCLLSQDVPWSWSDACQESFQKLKDILGKSPLLTYYDSTKPVRLAVDASFYGVGAVLSHVSEDGEEQPIAFASRTLSASEQNYSMIEKEALAIIFGLKKFHQYLYGRRFSLITDHKPLTLLLGPKRGIPVLAVSRLQRWAIQLGVYQYDIEYRASNIERPEELRFYFTKQDEFTTEEGYLLRGTTVVIPTKFQALVLAELHIDHPGMVRMKSLGRLHVWWSTLDQDIEQTVRDCPNCQFNRCKSPLKVSNPWIWPTRPWQRIHLDFAGPMDGVMYLIVVDAKSKWMEVLPMSSTTTATILRVLRFLFSLHGLPEEIVSDNGPQFVSQEMKDFLKSNGIRQCLSSPYHPASNGEAERAVRTFKDAMKVRKNEQGSTAEKLARFLLGYRTTPHTATGCTPAEILMGRRLRTRLDLLHPDLSARMERKTSNLKQFWLRIIEHVKIPGLKESFKRS